MQSKIKHSLEEMKGQAEEVSALLKSFGHPKRLLVLCFLADRDHSVHQLEELCDIGQSQLSQFLKRMELEGLLSSHKEGRQVIYSISDERVRQLIGQLQNIFCRKAKA
jgi:ArsR family transcriptional regulator